MNVTFTIPIEIVSEANARDHHMVKARRVKNQKGLAYGHCLVHMGCKPKDDPLPGSFTITLTRIMGKRQRPFDSDNLQSAFKAVRDGIAMYLGIDDGSDRLTWRYGQEKGVDGRGAVRAEIGEAGK
jgi:hypothetical protein